MAAAEAVAATPAAADGGKGQALNGYTHTQTHIHAQKTKTRGKLNTLTHMHMHSNTHTQHATWSCMSSRDSPSALGTWCVLLLVSRYVSVVYLS